MELHRPDAPVRQPGREFAQGQLGPVDPVAGFRQPQVDDEAHRRLQGRQRVIRQRGARLRRGAHPGGHRAGPRPARAGGGTGRIAGCCVITGRADWHGNHGMGFMKLVILGASSGVGRYAVDAAVSRGHDVTILVRMMTSYDFPASVRILEGTAAEPDDLDRALAGQDAVLSCVGIRFHSPGNPWSGFVSPDNLTEWIAQLLVGRMRKAGIRKLIALSAAGVGDGARGLHWLLRLLLRFSGLGLVYRDLANMEAVVGASDLEWMIVRPTRLHEQRANGRLKEVTRVGVFDKVSCRDVAVFLVKSIERGGFEKSVRQLSQG
ncbi:MAG: hypothetical protein EXR79_16475 [Myxococcales bacterium]|nr:hypothetical protein [Myxococcales bacterium]